MGALRLGPPPHLVRALRDAAGIALFVETGTYKGGTALWAAGEFPRVVTIEAYEPRWRKTTAGVADKVAPECQVTWILGDSRTTLGRALFQNPGPAILWLDAHWCGEGAHTSNGDECPLREELRTVNISTHAAEHIILIDDARLFANPPPYPHDPAQWPSLPEVIALVTQTVPRFVVIHQDVILAVPTEHPHLALIALDWSTGVAYQGDAAHPSGMQEGTHA